MRTLINHQENGYLARASALRKEFRALQAERAVPTKEQAQPQSALEKIVEDAKRPTPEPAPDKQPPEHTLSAVEQIVQDARRRTRTPRPGQTDPDRYKVLSPQEKKDLQNQQELERKAQKDRDRGR
jgi:hypothetical protein